MLHTFFLELAVYIMYICITYALNKNKAKGKDGRPVSGPKEGHFSLKKNCYIICCVWFTFCSLGMGVFTALVDFLFQNCPFF